MRETAPEGRLAAESGHGIHGLRRHLRLRIPEPELRAAFCDEVRDDPHSEGTWVLGDCTLHLGRGEDGNVTNFSVSRPTGDDVLWEGLFGVLQRGDAVFYYPSEPLRPIVADLAAAEMMPEDMRESFGEPHLVVRRRNSSIRSTWSRHDQGRRELERALKAAKQRVERAVAAPAPKHKGGETEEFHAAVEEQLRLEREVALARGEEAALAIDWRPQWDVGAPLPHVLSSEGRTFLIYMVSEPDPAWDGTYVNVIDPSSDAVEPLAIVEFKWCYAHKFGGPNDEVVSGHPLYGKGLEAYRAHEVANSSGSQRSRPLTACMPATGQRRGRSGSTTCCSFATTVSSAWPKDSPSSWLDAVFVRRSIWSSPGCSTIDGTRLGQDSIDGVPHVTQQMRDVGHVQKPGR